jgi:hypothetical protein
MKATKRRDTNHRRVGDALDHAPVEMIRRKYVSPRLVVYGALADLTRSEGNDDLDPMFSGSTVTT